LTEQQRNTSSGKPVPLDKARRLVAFYVKVLHPNLGWNRATKQLSAKFVATPLYHSLLHQAIQLLRHGVSEDALRAVILEERRSNPNWKREKISLVDLYRRWQQNIVRGPAPCHPELFQFSPPTVMVRRCLTPKELLKLVYKLLKVDVTSLPEEIAERQQLRDEKVLLRLLERYSQDAILYATEIAGSNGLKDVRSIEAFCPQGERIEQRKRSLLRDYGIDLG